MSTVGTDDLAVLCLAAARAGGSAIADVVARKGVEVEEKDAGHDYVTSADHAAEAAVLRLIRSARPGDTVLTEETGVHPGDSTTRWVVDPLDGTVNFVHGRPDFATSVGVEQAGRPAAGAIVRHSDGSWVVGGRHGAATGPSGRVRDEVAVGGGDELAGTGTVVRLDDGVPAHRALVTVELGYAGTDLAHALRVVGGLVPRVGAVRVGGSVACDFVGLLRNECDAVIAINLAEWDTAAGRAVVLAAGGAVRVVTHSTGLTTTIAGPRSTVDDLERLVAPSDVS